MDGVDILHNNVGYNEDEGDDDHLFSIFIVCGYTFGVIGSSRSQQCRPRLPVHKTHVGFNPHGLTSPPQQRGTQQTFMYMKEPRLLF